MSDRFHPRDIGNGGSMAFSVERIEASSHQELRDDSDIERFVEEPLRSAVQLLLDKNIRTVSSSANADEGQSAAYIQIDAASLSDENSEIVQRFGATHVSGEHSGECWEFAMPITETTDTAEMAAYFHRVAEQLVPQEPSWVKPLTLDEIEAMLFVDFSTMSEGERNEFLSSFATDSEGHLYWDERDAQRVDRYHNIVTEK